MSFAIAGLLVLVVCALASLAGGRLGIRPWFFAVLGNVCAFLMSFGVCARCLLDGTEINLALAYSLPFGSVSVGIDPLSSFFLPPLLFLSSLASIYGIRYSEKTVDGGNSGVPWFFFNLLVASMVLVLISRSALAFLVSWELMSLSSYFLVVRDHGSRKVRDAGWIYIVSTHIGCAFIAAAFALVWRSCGSLDFSSMSASGSGIAGIAIFLFALAGFGSKAGLAPLHIWLPEAHPAAPSHVSALMSGIMIKMGIYGLLRFVGFLGAVELWWGLALVALGVLSGIGGVLYALAQHDLKRLLAYHSVENIGIIALGLGVGLAGEACGSRAVALLGISGALLHCLNHCIFKGLLFLGAGSVIWRTGTGEMDLLGGLGKKMPGTSISFLTGSASISGLPPFNGFISEFLIFLACLKSLASPSFALFLSGVAGLISLALIGGLALACFTKAFGTVFLGEPRSEASRVKYGDVPLSMRLPMYLLAISCLAIGLLAPLLLELLYFPAASIVGGYAADSAADRISFIRSAYPPLLAVSALSFLAISLASLILILRRISNGAQRCADQPTWDCGYISPDARMQYTSSSFAQPLTRFFQNCLRTSLSRPESRAIFPPEGSFSSHTSDFFLEKVLAPLFSGFRRISERLQSLDRSNVHASILFIVVATILLLGYCCLI